MSEPPDPAVAERLMLDQRRLALEERKQKLDESWPKKWGGIALGAFATVAASLITAGLGYFQHEADGKRAAEETKARTFVARESALNDQQLKKLENDRQAVTLFFQYLAEKREDDPRRQDKLGLIAAIATDPQILAPFRNAKVAAAVESGGAPSDALRGTQDLAAPQTPGGRVPLTAYIQFERGSESAKSAADSLQATVRELGLNSPGLQRVAQVPTHNEIRIYKSGQFAQAQQLARALAGRNGGYCIRQLANPQTLPDGVIEFWIGKQESAQPGAKC